jgi:hypothetical protein
MVRQVGDMATAIQIGSQTDSLGQLAGCLLTSDLPYKGQARSHGSCETDGVCLGLQSGWKVWQLAVGAM